MKFNATLEGSQQVPPVNTTARGQAVIKFLENKNAVSYRLSLRNIQRMFQAHIHMGRRGTNGPVIAPMFNGSPGISVNQANIMGTITQSELTGPLEGRTIEDLVAEMEAGNTYVNVHTEPNPDGEIRGQIHRTGKD